MRLSSRLLAVSEIRPGSWARAWNSWGRSLRLDFQALFLEVIPKALAAPMVVALWAHLLESGRHCNGAARDDVGNDLMSGVTGENYIWSFGVVTRNPVLDEKFAEKN